MKHTAGNWHVERDGGSPYIIDSTKLVRLADVCTVENTGAGGSTKANAYLMAAAPALLDACKNLLNYLDTGDMKPLDMRLAREAIAKAEGR